MLRFLKFHGVIASYGQAALLLHSVKDGVSTPYLDSLGALHCSSSFECCGGGEDAEACGVGPGWITRPARGRSRPRDNIISRRRRVKTTPNFPEHRLRNPKWQAERRIYEDIEACDLPSHALYGVRPAGPAGSSISWCSWRT